MSQATNTATITKPLTLTMPRKAMLDAVKIADSIIAKRSPKPILKYCRVILNGHASITATDMERAIELPLRADYRGEGDFLVNPSELKKLLTKSKAANATLTANADTGVRLEMDGMRLTVDSRDGSEYPADNDNLEPNDPKTTSTLFTNAGDLLTGLKRTMFAADPETTRYALGGVMFECDWNEASGDSLLLVASDGRRLSLAEMPVEVTRREEWNGKETTATNLDGKEVKIPGQMPIVSLKVCCVVESLLSKMPASAPITIKRDKNRIQFSMDGATVNGLLLEGRFPRYRDVIPAQTDCRFAAIIDPKTAMEALSLAHAGTIEEQQGADFCFGQSEVSVKSLNCRAAFPAKVIRLRTDEFEGHEPSHTFDKFTDKYDCDSPIGVMLKPQFVMDYAKLASQFVLLVRDENSAVTMKQVNGGWLYVVMPLGRDK